MTDFAAQRRNMVDGQVRTADVTNLRILDAMMDVPRERFAPPTAAAIAYLDLDLPVGEGRRLIKPMVLGKLLQAADIAPGARVLVVGAATGYSAAVLGRMGAQVVALEQDDSLIAAARAALASEPNVSVVKGPLVAGWPSGALYDAILLEGATGEVPEVLCRQLADGGRLLCVLGAGPGSKAMLYLRSGDDFGGRPIFDAAAAVLPGFAKKSEFAF